MTVPQCWTECAVQYDIALGIGQLADVLRGGILNGCNLIVDTTWADVWDVGGVYPLQPAPGTLQVVSTSAADSAAGTGARRVAVSGLVGGVETTVEVALNGTTPVPLGAMLWDSPVNGAQVTAAGSGEVNAGDVTVSRVVGGAVQARIRAGVGLAQSSVYRVPAGWTFLIGSFFLSCRPSGTQKASGNTCEFRFGLRLPGASNWLYPSLLAIADSGSPVEFNARPSVAAFPGGTVFKMQVRSPSSPPTLTASIGLVYTLIKDGVNYLNKLG